METKGLETGNKCPPSCPLFGKGWSSQAWSNFISPKLQNPEMTRIPFCGDYTLVPETNVILIHLTVQLSKGHRSHLQHVRIVSGTCEIVTSRSLRNGLFWFILFFFHTCNCGVSICIYIYVYIYIYYMHVLVELLIITLYYTHLYHLYLRTMNRS